MAEPFLSEIRILSFEFARKGWALCNEQFLPINQNQALLSLLAELPVAMGQRLKRTSELAGTEQGWPRARGERHELLADASGASGLQNEKRR